MFGNNCWWKKSRNPAPTGMYKKPHKEWDNKLPKLNWWVYRILSINIPNQLLTPSTVPFTDHLDSLDSQASARGFLCFRQGGWSLITQRIGRKEALKPYKNPWKHKVEESKLFFQNVKKVIPETLFLCWKGIINHVLGICVQFLFVLRDPAVIQLIGVWSKIASSNWASPESWIHHILTIDLYKPSSKSGATNNTLHNCTTSWDTVDGRNPAPVDEKFIPLFTGFYTYQVVQDFFHQQNLSGCKGFTNGCKQNGAPSASPELVSFLKTHPANPSPLQHHTVETQDGMGNNDTEKLLVKMNILDLWHIITYFVIVERTNCNKDIMTSYSALLDQHVRTTLEIAEQDLSRIWRPCWSYITQMKKTIYCVGNVWANNHTQWIPNE